MNDFIHIHLNSTNAIKFYNGTYNSQVEFSLPLLDLPSEYTIYLSVCHVAIPYSFYNINSSNNFLVYSVLGQIYTLSIPVGNYTTNNLLSTLKNLFINTFSISYSSITNQLTFTNNQDFIFYYNSTDPITLQSTCFGILGFSLNYQYSSNKTLVSNTMVNLSSVRCLCICSQFQTQNISTIALNKRNILCSIPIHVSPFTMITYENQGYKTNLNSNIFNSVIINIMDQDGNYINFNGIHWSITLQLEIVNYVN